MGYAHEMKRRRLETPWKPGNSDFFFLLLDRLDIFQISDLPVNTPKLQIFIKTKKQKKKKKKKKKES
ncbi:hypothetical protein VN97_g7358 [Penicillium thymicola]|uniref:Uncharacterized protein n=1 Tax=Penicillium thymicola TaxID=293382 RepID=A0AAI9TFS5_PENTH|nr:hypothetical protein VN97_g7358 [Penicillium thymicola]